METQNGVYRLMNALGEEHLFLDADSKLEDVVGFAKRFNKTCNLENRFVYLKYKEEIVEIHDEIGVC